MPRDKINEIHAFFVNDSDLIDSFLVCIKSNSFQKYPEVNSFARSFGGVYGFSELFQVWIDEQVHLLLFPKKTKSSMVGIPEEPAVLLGTSSSPIAVQPPEIPAILSSIPEPLRESDIMLRVLGATMHVKQKKPKKRLAPTAVATPSVATMPLPAAEEPAAEVNPRDSFGISVPVGNILPADALYACCSTRPAENVPVEDILTASNDVPLAANCLSEPLLVDNGLSVLRVGTSLNGDSSDAGEMRRDRDLLTVSEVRTLVNISAVYAALVVHLYIPFAVGVPFLAKLLGAVVNQNKPGTLPTPSPCVFKSIIHVHVFAAKAVEFCLPLFGHLGSDLALELVNCTALSTYCPEAAQLLRSLADDSFTEREKRVGGAAVGYGSPDAVAGDLGRRDAFIRPFRADEDDRNLYKTQVCLQCHVYLALPS